MNAKSQTILYFAYGEHYVDQALFSLASLVNVYRGKVPVFRILVYTDLPDAFECLRQYLSIETIFISQDRLQLLTGPEKDILKPKILILREALNGACGNLLFVDTDTVYLKRIDRLFERIGAGALLLHKPEWFLSKGRRLNPALCPEDLQIDRKRPAERHWRAVS